MLLLEIIGALAGILSVFLLSRQNILGWPTGLVYILLAMILFFNARLYGELIAHIFFFVLSLYGWKKWKPGSSNDQESLLPTFLNLTQRSWLFGLIAISAVLTGYLFALYTNNALPFVDSLVMTLSFAGMWLSANKKMENWMIWMLVNTLSIAIYLSQGLYVYAVLYCIFLVQAVNGFTTWNQSLRSAHGIR